MSRFFNLLRSIYFKISLKAFHRHQQKLFKTCGKDVVFRGRSHFSFPHKIEFGENVWLGEGAWFRGDGGIKVGDNTIISRNFTVFSSSHMYEGETLPYDRRNILKPVTIGKNVWIGMNVMITPGVTIGDGAIIGLGTVVSKDVPPLAIVGNQPFRILKYRDEAHYEELEKNQKYLSTQRIFKKKR